MRAGVICGDRWHPAQVVEEGLKPLEAKGYEFETVKLSDSSNLSDIEGFRVLILAKSGERTEADDPSWGGAHIENLLCEYVKKGGGFLVVHSGTAGQKELPRLRKMMGGSFIQHPERCPVTVEIIGQHPVCEGAQSFTVEDEHYFMQMEHTDVDVFFNTVSHHGSQPGGWACAYGEGRVCVLTPGHTLEVWLHDFFQKTLDNAIAWCTKQRQG